MLLEQSMERDLAVETEGQAEWIILQWTISQPQQVLRVDMKHQFSKLLTERCHWIGSLLRSQTNFKQKRLKCQ